MMHRQENIR